MSKTANITEYLNSRKVELSSEAVELTLMDDVKAAVGQYKALDDSAKKSRSKAADALIGYTDSIRVAYQNTTKAIDLINQLDAKSKELGLPDSGLGGYKKEMTAKSKEYKDLFNKIDAIAKSL